MSSTPVEELLVRLMTLSSRIGVAGERGEPEGRLRSARLDALRDVRRAFAEAGRLDSGREAEGSPEGS